MEVLDRVAGEVCVMGALCSGFTFLWSASLAAGRAISHDLYQRAWRCKKPDSEPPPPPPPLHPPPLPSGVEGRSVEGRKGTGTSLRA